MPQEYKFFPKTWLMPQEAQQFRNQFLDKNGKPMRSKKTYIVKPDALSQGQGIYLSRNCEKIIKNCTEALDGGYVVQEYLDKPHLVDDLKYDLRIYVMLYGINPMRVFLHEKAIARFATESYVQPKNSNMDNLYMHLTNYAINRNADNFEANEGGEDDEGGHKRTVTSVLKFIEETKGVKMEHIWDQIDDIAVKTLISAAP